MFFIILPLYRRLNVYSAYEYLERRFGLGVRGLGAAVFMLWRMCWMATALYVPCLTISTAIGRSDVILPMIATLGTLVTFYTMLGGIHAVIWTDVTQFCIMFLGLAGTVVIAWWNVPGGFSKIAAEALKVGAAATPPATASSNGIFASLCEFIATPVTALSVFIAIVVSRLGTYTSDQVMVQRFQTTRSIREARRGFLITAISDVIWMVALALVGVSLFAYFHYHPIPSIVEENPDNIFPYFLGQVFPAGMTGLVIAAILAASLSSIDSALNSLTSVATIDFYNRIYLKRTRTDNALDQQQERRQVLISRAATLVLGAVGTLFACNVSRLGTIFEISYKLLNSFTGPLLGIFLLGMFTKRANGLGVFIGGLVGTAVTLWTIHLSNIGLVSFLLPSAFGLTATIVVGYAVSLATGKISPPRPQWTFQAVKTRIEIDMEQGR